MDWRIDNYIKDLVEEMVCTPEEAKRLIEEATRPVDISIMDEEYQKIIDKLCEIDNTGYLITADELKKILKEKGNNKI